MMKTEDWTPKGIKHLEPAAWLALRDTGNIGIVAGPGAGKTEFLAQKAAYLLETGLCRSPRRILAISFKKDAASNLSARVRKRCAVEESARFDSMTFDGFAKSFVDRFRNALPTGWQPPTKYDVAQFTDQQYRGFLDQLALQYPQHKGPLIAEKRGYQNKVFGTYKLGTPAAADLNEFIAESWYKTLFGRAPDFMMLNRLTEYMIRAQAQLAKALQLTYEFIFVDEFQDTTYSQYDLVSTIIQRSGAAITAVGDNKQRIMVWAGAKPDSFNLFFSEFRATKYALLANYRSTPELVRIQNSLSLALEPGFQAAISAARPLIDENVAAIWNFQTPSSEFSYLANWLAADRAARNLTEQDYAILVRQKPDDFHTDLSEAFSPLGIEVCNQAQRIGKTTLQDLLSEECFQFLAALIRLSVSKQAPKSWTLCVEVLEALFPRDVTENKSTGPSLDSILDRIDPIFLHFEDAPTRLSKFFETVTEILGEDTMRGAFPDLLNKDNYAIFVDAFHTHGAACALKAADWHQFVDCLEAIGQVALLTVHKSKGLEYDTVLFIGLDDNSWWSYPSNSDEGNATFFVALSRAKQRVIFTYSKGETGRTKISDLYRLLKEAGVPEHIIEAN